MRLPRLIEALGAFEKFRARARERRLADDWLTSATGAFVPAKYEWRARDLTSAVQRRRLAHTLRLIDQSSDERPLGRRRPLDLTAARHHRQAVRTLTARLESVDEPVTPAGMLRVRALLTDGASPLYGFTKSDALGDEIALTLSLLDPVSRQRVA
jgi:hypothetical protein